MYSGPFILRPPIDGTKKMWSYIAGGLKDQLPQNIGPKNIALWDQIKQSYNQGWSCKIEGLLYTVQTVMQILRVKMTIRFRTNFKVPGMYRLSTEHMVQWSLS